jgi:L-lactate dehydrogenase complex protein LldG
MSANRENGRDTILGALRRSLKRAPGDGAQARVDTRLSAKGRGPVPARSQLRPAAQVDLFQAMAEELSSSVTRVARLDQVPGAIAAYLTQHNLPTRLRMAPNPMLETLPWDRAPLLNVSSGRSDGTDEVSLTGAFAGVAETGTLMLHSGATHPTTLNFLPDTHIVVLKASDIVGPYEDAWDRVRAARQGADLPRTVNFVTGPSRTADIEQTIQLGAHGPRRLHIVIVEDGVSAGAKGQGNAP